MRTYRTRAEPRPGHFLDADCDLLSRVRSPKTVVFQWQRLEPVEVHQLSQSQACLADLIVGLRFSTHTLIENKIRPLTHQELQEPVSPSEE